MDASAGGRESKILSGLGAGFVPPLNFHISNMSSFEKVMTRQLNKRAYSKGRMEEGTEARKGGRDKGRWNGRA